MRLPLRLPPAPGDPFGEDTTLTAKPIVFVKGTGNWDSAFETITGSLKTLTAYSPKKTSRPTAIR